MSNPDTWMPLYISRYLGDTGHLTVAEHGAYLLLLMQYWMRGPLPDDDQDLAIMAKTDTKLWRKSIGPKIRKFFVLRADGLLHQKRIDAELEKAGTIIRKKRAAANTRWGSEGPPPRPPPNGHDNDHPAHADAMHVHSTSTASGEHTQSTSTAPAVHMECPVPLPVPREETEGSNQGSVNNHLLEGLVSAREPASEAFSDAAIAAAITGLAKSQRMKAYPPREPLRTRNDQVAVIGKPPARPTAFHLTREQINHQLQMRRRRQ